MLEARDLELEKKQFVSFDGGVMEFAAYQRPDRYRTIENSLGKQFRIARGGGYSYAPASFGKGVIVQDLTLFNRILRFDHTHSLVKVEAGITLSDLLNVTIPSGLWLPVIPGYPEITVGGCIASNVHGKNPAYKGTFRKYVREITLFHPAYGTISVSEETNPFIFNLTCGGYGLTGLIVSATLQLEKLPGVKTIVKRTMVTSLEEAFQVISELSRKNEFAYSMHQANPDQKKFGRGYVSCGNMISDSSNCWSMPEYKIIKASNRGAIPFSVFGGSRTRLILGVHWFMENAKKNEITETLFDSMFPFVRNWYYFCLYGKRGLAEYQMIIPTKDVESFLTEFQRIMVKEKPPAVMCSIKLFKGTPNLLRFEMNGACLALDLIRCTKTLEFLSILDSMIISSHGIPSIIKDSRLPDKVVQKCYPEYELMKKHLSDYDPERLYRSEMSERLGL